MSYLKVFGMAMFLYILHRIFTGMNTCGSSVGDVVAISIRACDFNHYTISTTICYKMHSLSTGFEPVRAKPNGFQVHRLNHSATTALGKGGIKKVCIFENCLSYFNQLLSWLTVPIRIQLLHRRHRGNLYDVCATTATSDAGDNTGF